MRKICFYCICIVVLFATCTKDKKPTEGFGLLNDINTKDITEITTRTAKSGAVISNNGSTDIVSKGLCWSQQSNPTINGNKIVAGSGLASFDATLAGLSPTTTYYVRAFATTSIATYYGVEKSFKTSDVIASTVSTNLNVLNISQDSATSGGTVSNDGGGTISARGVCWSSTKSTPTIADSKTQDNIGTGAFSSSLKNLTANTTYYVRAYATNESGTSYGNVVQFTTLQISVPIVSSTESITSINYTSAIGGGTILSTGGATITSRGICWSTNSNPTVNNSRSSDGTGIGSFVSSLTGLTAGTLYYVRAYGTNSVGTGYGPQVQFITISNSTPSVTATTSITNISKNSATSGGTISNDGGLSISAKGVCWSTNSSPTINNSKTNDGVGTNAFTSQITGLNAGTTYYVRSYATNQLGTSYGPQIQFNTSALTLPVVTTQSVSSITINSAISGGNVIDDGGGTISAQGVCWSTSSNPTTNNFKTTNGTGLGSYISTLTGLSPSTIYYVRAYATNQIGTAYGIQIQFGTSSISLPIVTTSSISNILFNSATGGGNVTSDGGGTVTSKGVCWSSITSTPTISGSFSSDGSGLGSFVSSITNITPSTTYYVRAYATNQSGTSYGAATSFVSKAISIGDTYQGGVVAYILQSGDPGYSSSIPHGLIISTSNQSTGSQWGCSGISISGADGIVIGSGSQNTTDIINGCTTVAIAAKLCYDYSSGGYSDWHLPSKDELNKIYLNRSLILSNGGITFGSASYWSSSESTSTTSWSQSFVTGTQSTTTKSTSLYVRAIRSF